MAKWGEGESHSHTFPPLLASVESHFSFLHHFLAEFFIFFLQLEVPLDRPKNTSYIDRSHASKLRCQVMRLALMSTNKHRLKDKLTGWNGTDANSQLFQKKRRTLRSSQYY